MWGLYFPKLPDKASGLRARIQGLGFRVWGLQAEAPQI